MRIFLMGMPGAGKTTLGRQLASFLNYPFLDLDEAIVAAAGLTIPEIFARHGETYFRQMEAQTLQTVAKNDKNLVVATGGGTPCFYNNLAFMSAQGLTVYLKATAKELAKRLTQKGLGGRPLLAGKTAEELLIFLQESLVQRATFYGQAGIIFETCDADSDASELARLIRQREI